MAMALNSGMAETLTTPRNTPSTSPTSAPISATMIASQRIIARTLRRERPTARSSPISRVRSKTDSARVRTMPKIAMTTAIARRT